MVPDDPRVVVKPMFGNLGAFVNGNMFAGLFGDRIGVRVLDDARRAELAATDGAGPFGPEERPMGGYVAAPAAWSGEPERLAGVGGAGVRGGRRRCRRRRRSGEGRRRRPKRTTS